MQAKKTAIAVRGIVLVSLLLLIGFLAGPGPVMAQDATVEFDPPPLALDPGCRGFVDLLVGDFTSTGGLGGYNITVFYNPSVVEVTDVDGGNPPFGSDPVANIDNSSGEVRVSTFQAFQRPGPTGNIRIARLNLRALGSSGATSVLSIDSVNLVDADSGASVSATGTNDSVNVVSGTPCVTVSGETTLQFRSSTGGRALVEASCPSIGATAVPADDGTWQIPGMPAESCTFTATAPGYLTAQRQIAVGSSDLAVPPNQLLGGDANKDGVVALSDITGIITQFAQTSTNCEIDGLVVDVNCDGVVALNDITGAITNFAKSSPQPF